MVLREGAKVSVRSRATGAIPSAHAPDQLAAGDDGSDAERGVKVHADERERLAVRGKEAKHFGGDADKVEDGDDEIHRVDLGRLVVAAAAQRCGTEDDAVDCGDEAGSEAVQTSAVCLLRPVNTVKEAVQTSAGCLLRPAFTVRHSAQTAHRLETARNETSATTGGGSRGVHRLVDELRKSAAPPSQLEGE